MKSLAIVSMVLSTVCIASTATVYVVMNNQVQHLERELQSQKQKQSGADNPRPADLRTRLAILESKISFLENRPATARPEAGKKVVFPGNQKNEASKVADKSTTTPGANGEPNSANPDGKQDLAQKVKKLEKKMGAIQKKISDKESEKKPSFRQFVARLELDGYQQGEVLEIVRKSKEDLLVALKKPLADGSNLLDQLGESIYLAAVDPEKSKKLGGKFWINLFTKKVPGTRQTYVEYINQLNKQTAENMRRLMRDDQKKKYDSWSPQTSDIRLENGPLDKYLKQYVERRKAQKK